MGYGPAMFSEVCLIGICPKAGTDVQFAAMISSVDIDTGTKDIEQVPTLSGGRLIKKLPQDIATISFEGYPIGVNTSGGKGISQMFHVTQGSYDTTEPLIVSPTLQRDQFRITILFAEDIGLPNGPTLASTASTAKLVAYRIGFYNAYMTSMKPSYTDGELKVAFEFKCAPFNKQGTAQMKEESTDTTTALTALTTYNVTNFPEDGTTFTFY